ncbi:MAG TPA: type IV secretory system conjugative DNA transfer family protein [Chthoniobacteraceae bacterium]|nr:type IV secretory system conjugative DNA transfer family protein [Chthoniobacteraceae bacterium]
MIEGQLFDLNTALFCWKTPAGTETDAFTLRNACEGIHIFGGTGSGKTSGSGRAIALAYLRAGFGGLVLTSKPEETAQWRAYCAEAGRASSLRVVSMRPGSAECGRHRFNFLDAEARRGVGALIENVLELFMTILAMSRKDSGGEEPFWEYATRDLLRNAITLCHHADGAVSLSALRGVATASARPVTDDDESYAMREWLRHPVGRRIAELRRRLGAGELEAAQSDLTETFAYWEELFPAIPEKTRGTIITYFSGLAGMFLRSPMRELLCEETTLRPEATWEEGAIIVLDLPVLEYHEGGRLAQAIFKYMWQRAVQTRDLKRNERSVFLFADENQLFLNRHDFLFQSIARGFRSCTVAMTQNISNYFAVLGGEDGGRPQVESLLGNFQTHVFHANLNTPTNQWAAESIGKEWQTRMSVSAGGGSSGQLMGGANATMHQDYDYHVQPGEFTRVPTGGPDSNFAVGAYVLKAGLPFKSSQKNFLKVVFRQKQS